MNRLHVQGMWGLGDNIFQRAFIKGLSLEQEIWLDTPWPEIYADLDLHFVLQKRELRTQMKNALRQPRGTYEGVPHGVPSVRVGYGASLASSSIVHEMERTLRSSTPPAWDLPDMGPSPLQVDRPIAVIRPVTVRKEWTNTARNPLPEYVNALAERLMVSHHVVLLGDMKAGQEWLDGGLSPHHSAFLSGELNVRQMLALIRDVDVVIGGVGWIVPAAIALQTPTFVVLGGQGGHNHPDRILDPRMNTSNLGFAYPRSFCQCTNMRHHCVKTTPDLHQQFDRWATSVRSMGRFPAPVSRGSRRSVSGTTQFALA